MDEGLLYRLIVCIVSVTLLLYVYIDKQNDVTEVKMHIPKLQSSLQEAVLRNESLKLECGLLESPKRLIKLLRDPLYSHLRFPCRDDLIVITNE